MFQLQPCMRVNYEPASSTSSNPASGAVPMTAMHYHRSINTFVEVAFTHSSTWKATTAALQLTANNRCLQQVVIDVIQGMDASMYENKSQMEESSITLYYKSIFTAYKEYEKVL
ncbi:hypothetical protein E2C01_012744 [Portunus trituberculatus]|uniref:Uncharacterized protein n=1 Tax=Portunus trituberculatus TaxID=210409 RepID=A0A5B7DFJ0_PORTR|nr:hypothetical protein [Portunus trituberculatus]